MVFGAISRNGKLPLVCSIWMLGQEQYNELLKSSFRAASMFLFRDRKGVFMQDNAP